MSKGLALNHKEAAELTGLTSLGTHISQFLSSAGLGVERIYATGITMNNYTYQKALKRIWSEAVEKYKGGNEKPDTYFDAATLAELASMGLNVMDVFDYAEDFVSGGDPDFETFLMICEARRDYFLTIQEGKPSTKRLDPASLPAKDSSIKGIVWLPRIMPKALAKLRGEMPSSTMYCCGGDRRFFKTNNIHPAEFLRAAWAFEEEPDRLVEWVVERSAGS